MDVIVPQMNSEAAVQALETLKSVDLSKVDDLVILYDLQGLQGRPHGLRRGKR